MNKRENFGTRLGFLLVSAGCAIGLGNIWKFPWMTGQYGGGAFVLLYFIFLLILGIPVLTMELAIGRASGQTIVNAYRKLEKPGSKWHIHGWFCAAGCYLLMMFYVPVAGWMVNYFWKFISGQFTGMAELAQSGAAAAEVVEASGAAFSGMLGNAWEMIIFMLIVCIGSFLVCGMGLQKGVEKITKVMMIGLFALILVLIVKSVSLDGAKEGLKFYLLPDFKKAAEQGLGTVASAAMNQAFFTLSIGIASMEIFGSYMARDKSIFGEAVRITVLDTTVAVSAGLIIFPAVFTYGLDSTSGPSLIFVTLPTIFANMKFGRVWGMLFFLFMSFAALSTVIAVFENLVATLMDSFNMSRKKATVINMIAMLILTLPCILGFNVWSNVTVDYITASGAPATLDIQGMEDFAVSNILLPMGGLIYTLFSVYRFGWGFDGLKKEVNTGSGIQIPDWVRYPLIFVLPPLITVILVQGLFRPAHLIFGIVMGVIIVAADIYEIIAIVKEKKAAR